MESQGEEMATEWKNNGEGERRAKIEYVIGESIETERKRIARDERDSWEVWLEGWRDTQKGLKIYTRLNVRAEGKMGQMSGRRRKYARGG